MQKGQAEFPGGIPPMVVMPYSLTGLVERSRSLSRLNLGGIRFPDRFAAVEIFGRVDF